MKSGSECEVWYGGTSGRRTVGMANLNVTWIAGWIVKSGCREAGRRGLWRSYRWSRDSSGRPLAAAYKRADLHFAVKQDVPLECLGFVLTSHTDLELLRRISATTASKRRLRCRPSRALHVSAIPPEPGMEWATSWRGTRRRVLRSSARSGRSATAEVARGRRHGDPTG